MDRNCVSAKEVFESPEFGAFARIGVNIDLECNACSADLKGEVVTVTEQSGDTTLRLVIDPCENCLGLDGWAVLEAENEQLKTAAHAAIFALENLHQEMSDYLAGKCRRLRQQLQDVHKIKKGTAETAKV